MPSRHRGLHRATLTALRSGQTVELAGSRWKAADDQTLKPNRRYIGERHTGPRLLTVRHTTGGYVIPIEPGYAFAAAECVVVEAA